MYSTNYTILCHGLISCTLSGPVSDTPTYSLGIPANWAQTSLFLLLNFQTKAAMG